MEIKFTKFWRWIFQTYGNEVCVEIKFAKSMKWCSQSYGNSVCQVVEMKLQCCGNEVCKWS